MINQIVFGAGDNSHGQLGIDAYMSKVDVNELNLPAPIVSIHAGYYHSIFLDVHGKAYACGQGFNRTPQLVKGLEDEIITYATGGYDYSFFITKNGEVYGCGEIGNMVLGGGGKQDIMKIKGFHHKIVSASSGYYHTLFVSEEGVVYSCGRNQYNCLCRNVEEREHHNRGEDCKLLEHKHWNNIVQVSCGGYHSAALDNEGRSYVFGHSGFNQAPHDDNLQHTPYKTSIPNDSIEDPFPEAMILPHPSKERTLKCVSVAAGGWNTMVLASPYVEVFSRKNEKEMFQKLKMYLGESKAHHHLFDIEIVIGRDDIQA